MRKQLKSLMWLRRRIILSNKSLLIQVLLPFGFTYLYKKLTEIQGALNTESKVRLLVQCLSMALLFGAGNTISTIVSEEKEKKTLRPTICLRATPKSVRSASVMSVMWEKWRFGKR